MHNISLLYHPVTKREIIFPDVPLPDIRWIAGGSCGGKTVSSRHIAERVGCLVYDCDAERQRHFEQADKILHPALSRKIIWPDFFSSSIAEIFDFWEALCFERMEMILDDLSRLEVIGPVLVDGVYATPEIIQTVTPDARAVFLFAEEDFLYSYYYGRESTLWMEEVFATCADPEKTKKEWMEKWLPIDADRRKRAEIHGYPYLFAGFSTNWRIYEEKIMRVLGFKI